MAYVFGIIACNKGINDCRQGSREGKDIAGLKATRIKGLGDPNPGSPGTQQEKDGNLLARALIFLLYSYHILGVPCLGSPLKSP